MATIWDPDRLGIVPSIDEQHKRLFDAVARLIDACANCREDEEAPYILADIAAFAEKHFAYEESLLKATAFPELGAHVAQHEEMLAKMEGIAIQWTGGRTGNVEDIIDLLSYWVNVHILRDDMAFKDHLIAHGVT